MSRHGTLDVAAERARIALAALAALTRDQHASVQARLFEPEEVGRRAS